MKALRNCWYVADWSERIGEGELVGRRLLDHRVVLYRAEGKLAALHDICPHKLVPLSMGKVCGGRLRCGYHGLEFDESGACVRNPHGSQKIPAAAKVRTYPVVEKHSLIWIWMGDPALADPGAIPDFSMLDEPAKEPVLRRGYISVRANYELVVENLLDLSHSLFLHEGILGHEDMAGASIEVEQRGDQVQVRRFVGDVKPPSLFDLNYRRDGENVDIWADSRWDKPSCVLVETRVAHAGLPRSESTGLLGTHFLTPADERTTHYFFAAVRSNATSWGAEIDGEIQATAAELQRIAFEEQDEKMLEAQQRIRDELGMDRPPVVMLDVDAGVLRYQRVLHRLRQQERSFAEGDAA